MASIYLSIHLSIYIYLFLCLFIYLFILYVCERLRTHTSSPKTGPPPNGANMGQCIPAHCTSLHQGFLSLGFSIDLKPYDTSNTCNTHLICVLASGALVPHSLPENLWINGTSARTKSSPQTAPLEATRVFNNTKPAMMPNAGTSTNNNNKI